MDTRIGKNKYGIKLEDYSDYTAYKKACSYAANRLYLQTEKGKINRSKVLITYNKTKKSKLQKDRYRQSEKGKLSTFKYQSSVNGRKIRNALVSKRRASKLQRTPAWADLEAIKQFYLNCPKGYHVDHIVPLQGVNVSGFHVLNNLQYLTALENRKKSNKYAL